MANGTETEVEFIDCGSLSINYDATGKATISLGVVRYAGPDVSVDLQGTYTNRTWGDVKFSCVLMSSTPAPVIGSKGWSQWSLQMEGVGNPPHMAPA